MRSGEISYLKEDNFMALYKGKAKEFAIKGQPLGALVKSGWPRWRQARPLMAARVDAVGAAARSSQADQVPADPQCARSRAIARM